MYSGYHDREELEDDLYQEDEASEASDANSELEFHLYSQLHYSSNAGEMEELEAGEEEDLDTWESQQADVLEKTTDGDPEQKSTKQSKPTSSDDHLNTKKVTKKKKVVVLSSTSDSSGSQSESEPSVSSDSTDVDDLENWMILGQGRQDGDQSISLNVEGGSYDSGTGGPFLSAVCRAPFDQSLDICDTFLSVPRLPHRYYTGKNVQCRNCNKTGHLSKNCPDPRKLTACFLCGTTGHQASQCPNKHCNNCGQPGHLFNSCNEKAYWHKQCHRCSMRGHFFDACPEIWRHPSLLHLSCALSAHVACCTAPRKECTQQRMFSGVFPTYPFVNYYDTLEDISRRQHKIRLKVKGDSTPWKPKRPVPTTRDAPPVSKLVVDEADDFPRGGGPQQDKEQKMKRRRKHRTKKVDLSMAEGQRDWSPDRVCSTGGEWSRGPKSKNQSGEKKKRRKRAHKGANKQAARLVDQEEDNLFLIKQRKRSR
uniref:Zinc finger CCHC domain-containing protein 7 n=1 Tax=Fundulus heteroclitus TaxID=8078 RepID=A0A3Q2P7J3_FUNHE